MVIVMFSAIGIVPFLFPSEIYEWLFDVISKTEFYQNLKFGNSEIGEK